MSAFGVARAWVRAAMLRGRLEREMHQEMAAHIEQAAERFVERGMSEHDALLAARREFGHVGALQQHAREARGGLWLDSLTADLKYALRYYARTPLTTITIVLTLALAIGFPSAVFTVVSGVIRRPAPGVPDDATLVRFRGITTEPRALPSERALSYPELEAYAAMTDRFASVAGWAATDVMVRAGDGPDEHSNGALAQFVTPNYFATLGVGLVAGRGFTHTAFGALFPAELTAIVDHDFATERMGGVDAAIGKQVKVNRVSVTIVGVAPPGFRGAMRSGSERTIWMPLSSWDVVAKMDRRIFTSRNADAFEAFARLGPGVRMADARSAVRVVAARSDAAAASQVRRTWIGSTDVIRLRGLMALPGRSEQVWTMSTIALMAALLILLLCATTVSSLLVGAAIGRRHETGVRLAMGASRSRIVRQFLTEIAILALAGGALGMWVFGVLVRVIQISKQGYDVTPNWETTGFTVAYALLAAMLCGLAPALHATRTGLSEVLKDSSTGVTRRSWLQRTLVVAQIAVAQPLMIALALTTADLIGKLVPTAEARVQERVLTISVEADADVDPDAAKQIPGLMQRIAALPAVAAVLPGPSYGHNKMWLQSVPQRPPPETAEPTGPRGIAHVFAVPAGYFAAVDAPIVRGRGFVAGDTASAITPLILPERIAKRLFAEVDPVGQRVRGIGRFSNDTVAMEVVGVVRMEHEMFLPPLNEELPAFVPSSGTRGVLLVRTTESADALIPTITTIVRTETRALRLERILTVAQREQRRRAALTKVFSGVAGGGLFALLLASVGLYAMVGVAVGQRRREIGIRMALGARTRQVAMLLFLGGLRVSLQGLALGLPLSIVALGVIASREELPRALVVIVPAVVALVVILVSSLASWLPARRAARVDPMLALRSE